jgi:hypothetical protein
MHERCVDVNMCDTCASVHIRVHVNTGIHICPQVWRPPNMVAFLRMGTGRGSMFTRSCASTYWEHHGNQF